MRGNIKPQYFSSVTSVQITKKISNSSNCNGGLNIQIWQICEDNVQVVNTIAHTNTKQCFLVVHGHLEKLILFLPSKIDQQKKKKNEKLYLFSNNFVVLIKKDNHQFLSIGPMGRVFANGPGDRGSILGRVKKWYLMHLAWHSAL